MATYCEQRTENKQITAASIKQNHSPSDNKMEAHSGLNTLECLRGRLLAERQASRVAKQQAEAMGNQFVELENKVKEEIKLRNKAERKLKALKKKLECFNVSSPSSGQSHSSEKCESSCGSSLCSTASGDSEANETKLHAEKPALLESEVHNHNVGEEHALFQTHNSPFTAKHCGSKLNDASHCNSDLSKFFPQIPGKTPNQSLDNLKNDENRRLSLSSSKSLAKGYNSQTDDNSSNSSFP